MDSFRYQLDCLYSHLNPIAMEAEPIMGTTAEQCVTRTKRTMRTAVVLILFLSLGYNRANSQIFESLFSLGDTDNDLALCTAFLPTGSIATAGRYRGTIGSNGFSVSSTNLSWDAFVAVHDSNGICQGLWSIGTLNNENAQFISVLANGNIVVAGIWNSTNVCVNCQWFITCINPLTSNVIWSKTLNVVGGRITSLESFDNSTIIAADINGSSLINLADTTIVPLDDKSSLLWALGETGETLWAHSIGNQFGDDVSLQRITFNSAGDVAASGSFQYSAALADTVLYANGGLLDDDFFVAQFNPQGELNWIHQIDIEPIVGLGSWHVLTYSDNRDEYTWGVKYYNSYFPPFIDSVQYVRIESNGINIQSFKQEYTQPWLAGIQTDTYYELKKLRAVGSDYYGVLEVRDELLNITGGAAGYNNYAKLIRLDSNLLVQCEPQIPTAVQAYALFDFDISNDNSQLALAGSYSQGFTIENLTLGNPVGAQDAFAAIRNLPPSSIDIPQDTVLLTTPSFTLLGTNSNFPGSFSGFGVINDSIFDPSTAGIGDHEITWSTLDGNCVYTAVDTIHVVLTTDESNLLHNPLIRLYPNPSSTIIYFTGLIPSNDESIAIINSSGQRIMIQMKQNAIDVHSLERGIYVAIISLNDNLHHLRFIVN